MDYKRVLRLHYANQMSSRNIAASTGDSKTAINDFLKRFRECEQLAYPLADDVTNEAIEQALYRKPGIGLNGDFYRDFDLEALHRKLSHKGETLKRQWQLYNAEGEVDGKRPLSYRQFCRRYTEWVDGGKITFHIPRYPGINTELDFAGKTLCLRDQHDPSQTVPVTIFIAALSYSDYFYVEGMTTCDIRNWLRVNNNALTYFGGVTQTMTPDNCKVAVTSNKDWIDPCLNKDFQAWADHNGTVIQPAKVKSPRNKPVVEGHVKIVTMHILVEMEEMTFYSLEELNRVLWEKMDRENAASFTGLTYSRRFLFENEEKDTLQPLPDSPYEYLERKQVKVGQDFSFIFDNVHYTMPRKYLKETLEIRAGASKIYVYNTKGDLVRTHERSYTPKSWVVIPSDMPKEYGDYGYWNVPYFLAKAEKIGPQTRILLQKVIERFAHPVQAFRSCFGILRLAEKYNTEALESCCKDAILHGKCNYTYVANTVSSYAGKEETRKSMPAKRPADAKMAAEGIYKDDDDKYSLKNLLRQQEEGDRK